MSQNLPKWKCHKVVEAFKIGAIAVGATGDLYISSTDAAITVYVGKSYMRHVPKPGGYYVRYADGYESWSPAEAFDEGYTPLDPAGLRMTEMDSNSTQFAAIVADTDDIGVAGAGLTAIPWNTFSDNYRYTVYCGG